MPARSEFPGLIVRHRKTTTTKYWIAANVSRLAKGYEPQTIRLPPDAADDEIKRLCHEYTESLHRWLSGQETQTQIYTGTIASLCSLYARHPYSPVNGVKENTADSYRDSMKIISQTVGARLVRKVVGVDIVRWYTNWRAPAFPGGPERLKRAHQAISVLRMILRFGAACGHAECGRLDDEIANLRFERSRPRQSAITYEQVKAFIAAALEQERPYMAIGVAAQFETMLRQKDIIGEYRGDRWTGRFTWENIPGGLFRMETSKTGTPAKFDLTLYELLWPLLQAVPQAERTGAIVKGHDGQGIKEGRYRKLFRQIATQAGIPAHVWNMDTRAGGVTEALEAGADIGQVSRAATHSKEAMTARYAREVAQPIAEVAEIRKARRVK